jgi:hypothetical protein
MLGRIKRTTRLDVGLALSFTGIAFLVWSLVAGVSRTQMQKVILDTTDTNIVLPQFTKMVKVFFVDTGFVIDVAGLSWMVLTLVLAVLASRQKISISWAWMSAICQSFVATLGAVLVSGACIGIYGSKTSTTDPGTLAKLSQISLPVIIAVAILIWVIFVSWMLMERGRLRHHGPTLSDGMRSNV